MTMKMRDLIRAVRACKTAAEERATITKECALMRTAFKEERDEYREQNMAKLLFVHMLGYPTHWGQMECIKLIASHRFNEKRIGYLALMLLLDERAEVLMLITNSLQHDLNHPSPLVNGLALTVIGNIGTADIARSLARDVERHLTGGSHYTQKKAALACINMFKKAPDLVDDFIPKVITMLTEKSHSVLLTGLTLVTNMIDHDERLVERFVRLVPSLAKILKKLLTSAVTREYTVGGVTDPFLQARILGLLRRLGRGNVTASEEMNDILAQVATHTDTSKNTGHAVLYECVRTIMAVESESSLRALAVNLLGRFLLHRDNNIRYVALQTLCDVVHTDLAAVQRHRGTIVDCLKDPDISIRRRSLDLVYALTNAENVQMMAGEMINYLVTCTPEEREELCLKIASVAQKFAPTIRWEMDALIMMVAIAGNHVKRDILARLMFLLSRTDETQHRSLSHKLLTVLLENADAPDLQVELVHVAAWCVGEFGELLLLDPPPLPEAGDSVIPTGPRGQKRTEAELVDVLDRMLFHHVSTNETKNIVLSALLKLTVRVRNPEQLERIRRLLGSFSHSLDVELQQRSCEYSVIAAPGFLDDLRPSLLDHMPVVSEDALRARAGAGTGAVDAAHDLAGDEELMETAAATPGVSHGRSGITLPSAADLERSLVSAAPEEEDLFGLSDLLGLGTTPPSGASAASAASAAAGGGGAGPAARAAVGGAGVTATRAPEPVDPLAELLGMTAAARPTAAVPAISTPHEVFPMTTGGTVGAAKIVGAGPPGAATLDDPLASLFGAGPAISSPFGGAGGGVGGMGGMGGMPVSAAPAPAPTPAFTPAFPAFPSTSASSPAAAAPAPAPAFAPLVVYDEEGVRVVFAFDKPDGPASTTVAITATCSNTGALPISAFVLQSAVAKYMTQTLGVASGTDLAPHGGSVITQAIRVDNPQRGSKPLKVMLRLQFNRGGTEEVKTVQVTAFPAGL